MLAMQKHHGLRVLLFGHDRPSMWTLRCQSRRVARLPVHWLQGLLQKHSLHHLGMLPHPFSAGLYAEADFADGVFVLLAAVPEIRQGHR